MIGADISCFPKVFKFQYLVKKSAELKEVIVHEANKEEGEENKLSNNWIRVDMSSLRYKDLDLLEGIFKVWEAEGREAMSVRKSFDVRIRQLLGQRMENKVSRTVLSWQNYLTNYVVLARPVFLSV